MHFAIANTPLILFVLSILSDRGHLAASHLFQFKVPAYDQWHLPISGRGVCGISNILSLPAGRELRYS